MASVSSSLAGTLLLAMPGIGDPRFDRAAIAICSHAAAGALGIGIGFALPDLTLHMLYRQLELEPGLVPDAPVHLGGPVEPQRGFVLHSLDWRDEQTLVTDERWGLTGTIEILRAMAAGEGPANWIVALGYAGWAAGQLDEEMTRHGWFVAPASDALLFGTEAADRWSRAYTEAGIDSRMLAAGAGHA